MYFLWVSMYLAQKCQLGTLYYISYWRRDRHQVYVAIRATRRLLFCYFKTLSIGPIPGIEPAASRSAVKHSIDWAKPAAVQLPCRTQLIELNSTLARQ